jgi:hypothetical protein
VNLTGVSKNLKQKFESNWEYPSTFFYKKKHWVKLKILLYADKFSSQMLAWKI